MEHLQKLYEMKQEMVDKYNDYVAKSIYPMMMANNEQPKYLQIIREEIEHISRRIEYGKSASLNDAFLSHRLECAINENPEHFLDMINPIDIEKYLRKKKLNNIKNPV